MKEIVVVPGMGVNWRELVDLSIFDGFRPRMTSDQAARSVGPPDRQVETLGGIAYVYDGPRARIEVAHETYRSGPLSYDAWVLRAYPHGLKAAEFFRHAVVEQVPEIEGTAPIILMEGPRQDPVLHVDVTGRYVSRVQWIRE